MIEIKQCGTIVKRSQNLRGILDYARIQPVTSVSVTRTHDGGATVYVNFYDTAVCRFTFADFTVARDWFLKRRAWGKPVQSIVTDRVIIYHWTSEGWGEVKL